MIFSVTTLRDIPANVERFVRRNLGGGVDHMFVFLDGAQPEVAALLEGHPHVTFVTTDDSWWGKERRPNLNMRQMINAEMARLALGPVEEARWLFHIDGDEVVRLDRDVLDAVGPEWQVVALGILEAVGGMHPEGDPTWFKARLTRQQLSLLKVLGVLPRANNRLYFRGHIAGKVGVRPSADVRLGVHRAFDAAGGRAPAFVNPGLRLLHYESPSAEDFVRKWTALMASGPTLRQKRSRTLIGEALAALREQELSEEEAAPFLDRIYARVGADDVETLRGLKLLQHVDPDSEKREPEDLAPGVRDLLAQGLESFRDRSKTPLGAEAVARKRSAQAAHRNAE